MYSRNTSSTRPSIVGYGGTSRLFCRKKSARAYANATSWCDGPGGGGPSAIHACCRATDLRMAAHWKGGRVANCSGVSWLQSPWGGPAAAELGRGCEILGGASG